MLKNDVMNFKKFDEISMIRGVAQFRSSLGKKA
jgi:hypothetical protein